MLLSPCPIPEKDGQNSTHHFSSMPSSTPVEGGQVLDHHHRHVQYSTHASRTSLQIGTVPDPPIVLQPPPWVTTTQMVSLLDSFKERCHMFPSSPHGRRLLRSHTHSHHALPSSFPFTFLPQDAPADQPLCHGKRHKRRQHTPNQLACFPEARLDNQLHNSHRLLADLSTRDAPTPPMSRNTATPLLQPHPRHQDTSGKIDGPPPVTAVALVGHDGR